MFATDANKRERRRMAKSGPRFIPTHRFLEVYFLSRPRVEPSIYSTGRRASRKILELVTNLSQAQLSENEILLTNAKPLYLTQQNQ